MCIKFWRKKPEQSKQQEPVVKDLNPYKEGNSIMESDVYIVEEVEPELEIVQKKEKIQRYHVSQNKDKDATNFMKWRVRKDSSDKTIQYFDTQKLAIDFAQDLANRTGTTVVIHKLDGSIRKQDYSNKE